MSTKSFLIICFFFISIKSGAQNDVFEIARHGCLEDLHYVLKNYPEAINNRNSSGFTPLILACYNNNFELASYLAINAEDINYKSDIGTALMAAVYKRNIEIVKMLLDSKADPNIADVNGTTALHYAVQFNNEDLVQLLVVRGADINLNDNKGLSPLDYAIQKNNESILTRLKN